MFFAWLGVIVVSLFLGIWGWAQIIGSIQHITERNPIHTLLTISIWLIILAGGALLVIFVLPKFLWGMIGGYAASLIAVLLSGRIK